MRRQGQSSSAHYCVNGAGLKRRPAVGSQPEGALEKQGPWREWARWLAGIGREGGRTRRSTENG